MYTRNVILVRTHTVGTYTIRITLVSVRSVCVGRYLYPQGDQQNLALKIRFFSFFRLAIFDESPGRYKYSFRTFPTTRARQNVVLKKDTINRQ